MGMREKQANSSVEKPKMEETRFRAPKALN